MDCSQATEDTLPHPLLYRQTVVSSIMSCVRTGESCSLIGVASVGKSRLLHFLMRPDVRQHYLGESWERFLFLIIDRNNLAETSAWGLYELFLQELRDSFGEMRGSEICSEYAKSIDADYQRVATSRDGLPAQRCLSRWAKTLTREDNFRLVFLLDEFDDVLSGLDRGVFLNLRALRDDNKYRVSYILLTRRLLTLLRSDMETALEPFYELLSHNVFPVEPYNYADALAMIEQLMDRKQVHLNEAMIEQLVRATGGHSGLLRAGFEVACRTPSGQERLALRRMASDYSVEQECRKIWDSLTEREREVLSHVAARRQWPSSDDAVVQHLEVKGLLMPLEEGRKALFSPLFAKWVLRKLAI